MDLNKTAEQHDQAYSNLEVTKPNQRVMGTLDIMFLWFGMAAQLGVFTLGASFAGRVPFITLILTIIGANFLMGIILVLIGDIGTRYGINFAVFLHLPFGYNGAIFPAFLRAGVALCWFGIQTYFGALAINAVVSSIFGFEIWFLWYIIFGLAQISIAIYGIKGIRILENFAAPALCILCVWVAIILIRSNSLAILWNQPIVNQIPIWIIFTAILSYWSTVAINIPDYSRYFKLAGSDYWGYNRSSIMGQIPGVTLGMLIFLLFGFVGSTYTGKINPVEVVQEALGGGALIVGLLIVLLAQISTNVAANLYAPVNVLNTILKINFKRSTIIAGFIGLGLTFPWVLLDNFLTYLPTVGAILAPVAGIMLSDYYLVRNLKVNVRKLIERKEMPSVNFKAYFSYAIAVIFGIVFIEFSILISLPISIILYYLLHFKNVPV